MEILLKILEEFSLRIAPEIVQGIPPVVSLRFFQELLFQLHYEVLQECLLMDSIRSCSSRDAFKNSSTNPTKNPGRDSSKNFNTILISITKCSWSSLRNFQKFRQEFLQRLVYELDKRFLQDLFKEFVQMFLLEFSQRLTQNLLQRFLQQFFRRFLQKFFQRMLEIHLGILPEFQEVVKNIFSHKLFFNQKLNIQYQAPYRLQIASCKCFHIVIKVLDFK